MKYSSRARIKKGVAIIVLPFLILQATFVPTAFALDDFSETGFTPIENIQTETPAIENTESIILPEPGTSDSVSTGSSTADTVTGSEVPPNPEEESSSSGETATGSENPVEIEIPQDTAKELLDLDESPESTMEVEVSRGGSGDIEAFRVGTGITIADTIPTQDITITIATGTVITSADDIIDTPAPLDITDSTQEELSGAPLSPDGEGFEFGLDGEGLIFSQPVKVEAKIGAEDNTLVDLLVKHENESDFGTKGLTTSPYATCDADGNTSLPASAATVIDGMVTFYTCGASTFVITPSAGTATITSPGSGSTVTTLTPTISGSGSNTGAIISLTLSGSATVIGSGVVSSGSWSIVPNTSLGLGSQTLCISGGSCVTFTVAPNDTAPGGVTTGLNLWLKADAGTSTSTDGAATASWINQGTISSTLSASAGQQPLYRAGSSTNALNFNPTLDFDGVNDFFAGTSNYGVHTTNLFTSFSVAKPASGAAGTLYGGNANISNMAYHFIDGSNLSSFSAYLIANKVGVATHPANTPFLIGINRSAVNTFQHYNDGVTDGAAGGISGFGGSFTGINLNIGKRGSDEFNGDISEQIIYSGSLSSTDLRKVNSYLAIKYAFTLDQTTAQNYLDSTGNTIWDGTANAIYKNNITVIGRDDASALSQKQSKSVNTSGLVTVGKSVIALSNTLNTGIFATNRDFLSFGDDANSITVWTATGAPTNRLILAREWKVQETGTDAIDYVIQVPDNSSSLATRLPAEATTVYLLQDADGDFSSGATEVAMTLSGTNWATPLTDLDDGQFFTFATEILSAPGGVRTGLEFWVKANVGVYEDFNAGGASTNTTEDADIVEAWHDQSGLGNHLDDAQGGTPIYLNNSVNFNPAIDFNGGADAAIDFLQWDNGSNAPWFEGDTALSVISVVQSDVIENRGWLDTDTANDSSEYVFMSHGNGSLGYTLGANGTAGPNSFVDTVDLRSLHPTIVGFSYDGAQTGVDNIYDGFKNGKQYPVTGANAVNGPIATNVDKFSIGDGDSGTTPENWDGRIMEVMTYQSTLSPIDEQKINSYLAIKYGITLSGGTVDYLDSTGSTLWNATTNATYKNNITVIGRDDASALSQKQSKSVNSQTGGALITVGKNQIATTNSENTATFAADRDFLAVGDNSGSLSSWTGVGAPALRQVLSRVWKVQETGTDATDYKIQVPDNSSTLSTKLPTENTTLYLLQDTDNDFSTGATEIALTLSGTNWEGNVDFNNGDLFTFATQIPAAPGGVFSTLRVWLKADNGPDVTASGSNVTTWADQAGNSLDVTQPTLAKKPTYIPGGINFNPALKFDNGDNFYYDQTSGQIYTTDDFAAYVVATENTQAGWTDFISHPSTLAGAEDWMSVTEQATNAEYWVGGVQQNNTTANISLNKPFIIGLSTPATTTATGRYSLYNGTTTTFTHTTLAPTLSNKKLIIGAENNSLSETLDGNMAEVIIYNRHLTNTIERLKIESYLAIKYGITLSGGTVNYLDSTGSTIWNATTNSAYKNNITVIGRDDASALSQKQSKSVNSQTGGALVSVGNGNTIATTNSGNSNSFSVDRSFLAFGDNAGTPTWTPTGAPSSRFIIGRTWKVQETGSVGSVKIQVPDDSSTLSAKLPTEVTTVYLLQDSDSDFSAGATEIALTLSGTNWEGNVDFTNGDFFTFATQIPTAPGGVQSSTLVNGVYYERYNGYDAIPEDGISLPMIDYGYLHTLNNPDDYFLNDQANAFSMILKSKLQITNSGTYEFRFPAGLDDDAALFIDGNLIIAANIGGSSAVGVALSSGYHDIEVRYSDAGGTVTFQIDWRGTTAGLDTSTTFGTIADNKLFVLRGGPASWHKADRSISVADGVISTAWSDSSTNSNNLTNVGNPTYYSTTSGQLLNFNPSVLFSDDWMLSANDVSGFSYGQAGRSLFFVAKAGGVFTTDFLADYGRDNLANSSFYIGQNSTLDVGGRSAALTAASSFWDGMTSLGGAIYQNHTINTGSNVSLLGKGVVLSTANRGWSNYANDTYDLSIGNLVDGAVGDGFNGNIGEVVYFPWNLSANEKARVESYLAIKYGITLSGGTMNYLASDSSVLWNATTNSAYKNNITVIGRDDASALSQKQSKSANSQIGGALVTVGNGNTIATTNSGNTNSFSVDRSFLALGDNSGSLSWIPTGAPTSRKILSRIWKVQETGTVGSVKIQVPDSTSTLSTKLPTKIVTIYLLQDADGNFSTGATEIALTLSGTNWEGNVDFTNGDFFTFATQLSTAVPAPGGVNLAGDGTIGKPFRSLYDAYQAGISAGIYYFNIGGQTFSTYVDANGWVLIESGDYVTDESIYTYTTNLTLQSDKVLSASILSNLDVDGVRMNSSTGTVIDVTTSNASIISRLKSNQVLSQGIGDSAFWSGTNTAGLTMSCTPTVATLAERIWHSCGIGGNLHWLPNTGPATGEGFASTADDTSMNLWARGTTKIGLGLWLKADAGTSCSTSGCTLTSWSDSSPDINVATAFSSPTLTTINYNFNPGVTFNASNQYFDVTDGFANFTIGVASFVVARPTTSGSFARFYDFGNGQANNNILFGRSVATNNLVYEAYNGVTGGQVTTTTSPMVNNSNNIYSSNQSSNAVTISKNATSVIAGTTSITNNVTRTLNYIGRSNWAADAYYGGDMGEVIMYNSALSSTDHQRINSYLAIKYGITLSGGTLNYVDSSSGVLWNATTNATYKNNITVIGRDDASALSQKQSKSVNSNTGEALVTVGNGNTIATTNSGNTNNFSVDRSFLALGDNSGSLVWTGVSTPVGRQVLARTWKVQETGTVGSVKIQAPDSTSTLSTKLPAKIVTIYLLQDADGNFSSGATEIALTLSGTNWEGNVDFTNGDFFTFATQLPPAPGGVSTSLRKWFKADAEVYTDAACTISAINGTGVYCWKPNTSSALGNLTQATIGSRPLFNNGSNLLFNANPYLSFTTAQVLNMTDAFAATANPQSTFIVANAISSSQEVMATDVSNNGEYPISTTSVGYFNVNFSPVSYSYTHSIPAGQPFASTWHHGTGTNIAIKLGSNGREVSTTGTPGANNPNMGVGGPYLNNGAVYSGQVAEVVIYDQNLSDTNFQKVNTYLAIKYGTTLSGGTMNYISSNTGTIWNATNNSTHKNNITVIGRDDASALNQKQSKSVNTQTGGALVAVGNGNTIAATNSGNTNSFSVDLSFLALGDNSGSLVWTGVSTPVGRQVLARTWKVQETGTVGSVKIQAPDNSSSLPTSLPAESTTIYLLQDTDSNFSAGATEIALTLSGTNWEGNVDFTNGDFFTFATVFTDTTPPIVTLSGASSITIAQGSVYTDAGASWTDNVDGTGNTLIGTYNATGSFQSSGSVNTSIVGTYLIQYRKVDNAGNQSAIVTRTVTVTDQTNPIVTLSGASSITIAQGSVYTDDGASWTDNVDGTGNTLIGTYGSTGSFQSSGSVNTSLVGTYNVQFRKIDNAGNQSAIVTRTITVTDQTNPIVTVSPLSVTIDYGSGYTTGSGASWTDNVDGTGNTLIGTYGSTGSFQMSGTTITTSTLPGTYTQQYQKVDNAGNASPIQTRTITVNNTTVPVVTLSGASSITIAQGSVYTDDGASWTDTIDGSGSILTGTFNATGSFQSSGSVNTSLIGTYQIQFRKVNSLGNTSLIVTRTVTVNNVAPIANPDVLTVTEDSTGATINPILNDTDSYTGDVLSLSGIISNVTHGTLTFSGNVGTYVPTANYCGTDIFTYQTTDTTGPLASNTSTGTITITCVNDAPTDITLSGSSVNENNLTGTTISIFTTTDIDSATFTYSLVSGTGNADNAKFSITGSALNLNVSADYETQVSYSIRVRANDGAGGIFEKVFTINVVDVDDTPPTSTFVDNVAIGPVTADLVSYVAGDTGGSSLASVSYAFTFGTVCNGSESYTGTTSTGSNFTISDESKNGRYVCLRAVDGSGNTTYTRSSNILNIDITPPTSPSVQVNIASPYGINNPEIIFGSSTDLYFSGYTISIDGSPFTIESNPYYPTLTGSAHSVNVRAYDTLGNYTETTINYPPVVNITAPTTIKNSPITDTTIQVTGASGDIIQSIVFSGAGNSGWTCDTLPHAVPVNCTGGSINTSGVFEVSASNGGFTGSTTQTYTIETNNPSVTLALSGAFTSPTSTTSFPVNVTFSEVMTGSLLGTFSLTNASVLGISTTDNIHYTFTLTALADGLVSISLPVAQITDLAGNGNLVSNTLNITVDTTAPVSPSILSIGGDTSAPYYISDTTPTLTGTGEVGSTIIVRNASGTILGTSVVGTGGTYTVILVSILSEGANPISLTSTDPAGNESPSTSLSVTIDTTVPVTPTPSPLPSPSNTGALTLTGTAEPGSLITVTDGSGNTLCTATTNGSGAYSCGPLSPAPTGGSTPLTITSCDTASPANCSNTGITLLVDTTPPSAPSTPTSVGGDTTAPFSTSDTTPTITGSGTPGDTITIKNASGTIIGTVVVNGSGSYSLTVSPALPEGISPLTITATDPAGNESPSTSLSVTIDTTVPVTPTPSPLPSPSNTGALTLTGTAEPGSLITVTDGSGNTLCTATTNGSGAYSCGPLSPAPTGGSTPLTITSCDTASPANCSNTGITLLVDTTPPSAPSTPTSVGGDTTAPFSTSDTTPTITGSGTPGDTITIKNASGTIIGTVVVNGSGSYSLTVSPALPEGISPLTITATDPAGNESPSTSLSVTIDTTVPVTPTPSPLPSPSNTGALTLTGTAEPGSLITVTDGSGNTLCTATTNGSGAYSCGPLSPAPTGGSTPLTITSCDTASPANCSNTGITLLVDTTPPSAPSTPTSVGGDTTAPFSTSDTTPTITGSGTPGDTITIKNASGTIIGTVVVNGSGSYSLTVSPALPEGISPLTITATDPAGNESPSTSLSVTIDTTVPVTPTPSPLPSPSNTGALTLTGTAEPGSLITVTDGSGNTLCTATTNGSGAYSCGPLSPAPTGGSTPLTITSCDTASPANCSNTGITLLVDTTPPVTPTIIAPVASGTWNPVTTPVSGTGTLGDTIIITDGSGNIIGSGIVGVSGLFSILTTATSPTRTPIVVTECDAANNCTSTPPINITIVIPVVTPPPSGGGSSGGGSTPIFVPTSPSPILPDPTTLINQFLRILPTQSLVNPTGDKTDDGKEIFTLKDRLTDYICPQIVKVYNKSEILSTDIPKFGYTDDINALIMFRGLEINESLSGQTFKDYKKFGVVLNDAKFEPNLSLTRAEYVKMLVRALSCRYSYIGTQTPFSDVSPSAWYAGYIAFAVKNNWISGYDDGTFGPNNPVTRAEAAKILARAINIDTKGVVDTGFLDIAKSSTFAKYVGILTQKGIFKKNQNKTFEPNRLLKRNEAARIIYKTFLGGQR